MVSFFSLGPFGFFSIFWIFMVIAAIVINILITKVIPLGKEEMPQTGLLFFTNFSKISSAFNSVRNRVTKTLYISFVPSSKHSRLWFSDHITGIYTQSVKLCSNLDVRVLMENLKNPHLDIVRTVNPVDLVIFDDTLQSSEPQDYARSHISNLKDNFTVMNVESNEISEKSGNVSSAINSEDKTYDYVAMGGTFDRLHIGHKILLSQGILRANKHLTVGVTDVNMIKSKKLWELIEPIDQRIAKLKQFLYEVDSSLEYNVVAIQDIYGPTQSDPRLELLIVSQETVRGGNKVNEKRLENNLPVMDVHCIELAGEAEVSNEEEDKVSSSNRRMRLLGSVLKEPKENTNISSYPYVIGLTGGIASGKTNIAERLGNLGAGVVNCDQLAHELYRPGQPMNSTLAENFGADIIDANGEVNRKKLGEIVFKDPTRLIELNNLLWPKILELAQQRVKKLGEEGYRVVVMEAAVLIQANWQKSCHQVWTSIVPPEEAVKRLMERNGLTEKAAKDRLASQPSNVEQVAAANVVFSSLWSYDFTSSQVSKAWSNLLEYLDKKDNETNNT